MPKFNHHPRQYQTMSTMSSSHSKNGVVVLLYFAVAKQAFVGNVWQNWSGISITNVMDIWLWIPNTYAIFIALGSTLIMALAIKFSLFILLGSAIVFLIVCLIQYLYSIDVWKGHFEIHFWLDLVFNFLAFIVSNKVTIFISRNWSFYFKTLYQYSDSCISKG